MNQLQSETLGELAPALVKAQATMGVAIKDTTGQIGQNRNYKYADLASVMNAAADALEANGLATVQRPMPSESGVCIQTMIVHESGEWISDGGLHLPMQQITPQGAGSSITYARRYGLAAMLGVVQDDDDAASASAITPDLDAAFSGKPAPAKKAVAAKAKSSPAKTTNPAAKAQEAIAAAFDATPADNTEADQLMGFGKHKDTRLGDVPGNYLDWLLTQDAKDGYEAEHAEAHAKYRRELYRREQAVA